MFAPHGCRGVRVFLKERYRMEPKQCRCGSYPEAWVSNSGRGYYKGIIECPECGERVYGKSEWGDPADAVDDAIYEWNAQMPEEESDD